MCKLHFNLFEPFSPNDADRLVGPSRYVTINIDGADDNFQVTDGSNSEDSNGRSARDDGSSGCGMIGTSFVCLYVYSLYLKTSQIFGAKTFL